MAMVVCAYACLSIRVFNLKLFFILCNDRIVHHPFHFFPLHLHPFILFFFILTVFVCAKNNNTSRTSQHISLNRVRLQISTQIKWWSKSKSQMPALIACTELCACAAASLCSRCWCRQVLAGQTIEPTWPRLSECSDTNVPYYQQYEGTLVFK